MLTIASIHALIAGRVSAGWLVQGSNISMRLVRGLVGFGCDVSRRQHYEVVLRDRPAVFSFCNWTANALILNHR
jgi:hypothetical protein